MKNRRNAPPVSVRCTLPVRQRTPCSESRAFGWRLPSRMRKPCKYRSCRIPIPFPYKYRKQRCPFRFLHQRMTACCICSGNFCNQGKFEKTKEMHRLFQYGAHCLSGRERLAVRAERSGGDYRAERRSLARFALAEYLYHSYTNTGNNAARSGFCTRGWLFAVSVLGAAAIRRNLKNRRNAPPVSVRCTLLIRQRTPCSESRAFGWQLPSRTPKPCKVRSCRTPIPFSHKYRKQRCPFRFLHQRMAVCCICSGSCYNQAKFEYAGKESSSC